MAKKKAGDSRHIVVEMLQDGGPAFASMIVDVFTDVLDPCSMPPATWRSTRMIVLFKKGDASDPSNYRPIALLPILYKLFSKVIGTRLSEFLDKAQPVDQAGFRSGFSCEDHLFTVCLITRDIA
jgi:hypothetical protein